MLLTTHGRKGTSQNVGQSKRGWGAQGPLALGSSLKTWVRADTVKARTAAQFTRANSESLSIADASQTGLDMGTGDFTLACWIRMAALPGAGEVHYLMGKRTSGDGYQMILADSAGTLTLRGGIDDVGGFTSFNSAANPFSVDTWYFCVATFDRDGNGSLFLNNAATGTPGSIATRSGSIDNALAFALGSDGTPANFYNGRMSCAGVWTKVLSAPEMTTLYNAGVALRGSELTGSLLTGLVDYWDLTEESGTRASKSGANTLTDNNTVTANDGPTAAYAVTADGSVVYQGTDQGAAALAIVQATHANKPLLKTNIINGQAVLRFDGSNDTLKVATGAISNQPLWGWAVVDDNDAGARTYLDGGAASKVALRHDGTNLEVNAGSDVGAAHTAGDPHLVTFIVNGASSDIRVDGASIATGDAGAQNQDSGVAVGAANDGTAPLAGDIAEFAFVSGSPTALDLANLKAYINSRYNLSVA